MKEDTACMTPLYSCSYPHTTGHTALTFLLVASSSAESTQSTASTLTKYTTWNILLRMCWTVHSTLSHTSDFNMKSYRSCLNYACVYIHTYILTHVTKAVTAKIMFSAIYTPHTKSEDQYHLQYSILCIGSLYSYFPFSSPTINSICLVFPLYFSSTKIFSYS